MRERTAAQALRVAAAILCLLGAGTQAPGQSLWTARRSSERSLIADLTARRIGDILTVKVVEVLAVQDDGKVELKKATDLEAAIENFDIKPNAFDTLPALKYSNARNLDGEAKYKQTGNFQTTITAVVVDVKPNGNLLIEGRRTICLDGEYKQLRVRGLVRPVDVASDNSILSSRIADGDVFFQTDGERSRGTDKGWFEVILDFVWPF